MASGVHASVKMSPDFDRIIMETPQVRGAVTKEATATAERANSMAQEISGDWHVYQGAPQPGGGEWTDYPTHPNGVKVTTVHGGKKAVYAAKPARMIGGRPVAIVYTGNHAAKLDNYKHNTLLKAR